MSVEFDIARRLSSRKGGGRAGIMERVANIATAISLMVIILTLAVVVGFKRDVSTLISSVASDIVITAPQSMGTVSEQRIERSPSIEAMLNNEPNIERYSPYIAKEGVIRSEENMAAVMLKGVDQSYNTSFFEEHIVEGEMPRIGSTPRAKDVLLPQPIAQKMDAHVGDRIEIVFVDDNGGMLRDRFMVSGVYQSGVEVVDEAIALTDMPNVAREYDGDVTKITGYEVWLREDADATAVESNMNKHLAQLYLNEGVLAEAFTIERVFADLFGWLSTHDINALVITVIMIIVALLNMTTALLVIVLERQRMIGELRTLGMTRSSVVRIFLYRAMFIAWRGVAWGTLLGVVLVMVQYIWAPMPLPSEGYILTHVPVALCWGWWALAIVATMAVITMVMVLPALFATKSTPSEAIRYE
jgi:lipoprotein-releasing system permease protein